MEKYIHFITATRILLGISAVLCMGITIATNEGWKLAKDKNGVKVYTREVAGSALKEFKAETTVSSTVPKLVAMIKDFEAFPKWVSDCKEGKKLKEISPNEYYYYLELKAPWPVSNRDMAIHLIINEDPATKTVTCDLTGVPDYIAKKDDVVRIPKFKGLWKFTPKENGTVEVLHQAHAESGGSVPEWLANSTMTDGPLGTLTHMKAMAGNPH